MGRKATTKIMHSGSPEQTYQEGKKIGIILKKGDLIYNIKDIVLKNYRMF